MRHAALHDTFLIWPSDITEVWLKKIVADKTLKFSSMFAAGDGKRLAEYKLPASPVWGGMATAGGQLFISTRDGDIVCMGRRQENEKRLWVSLHSENKV